MLMIFCCCLQSFEARELEWDRREVELERIIESMERQQAQIAGAASQVGSGSRGCQSGRVR